MKPTRRELLALTASALAAGSLQAADAPSRLGIVIHSYPIHSRVQQKNGFTDPIRFLEFCQARGAGGVQLPLGNRDSAYTSRLRALIEKGGLYLEGSVRAPREKADLERFEAEVRTAKEAGATLVRTVMLSGRRYETFRTSDQYRAFKEQALRSLQLAEPVVARNKVRLSVENHKDYRAPELVEVMKTISSEWVGVCVDTGNNLALLEQPLATVEALAPWTTACHLKDMAVEESADGFLLAEVPLGEGFLDLKQITEVLRKARPGIRFSLEMITRDPLVIPCLKDDYWATFADVPGRDLARILSLVRKNARKQPLPRISTLSEADQLRVEDENVRRSLDFARKQLK
jgi:sugar phosphate isomerase/epimerase